jgi:hypothetical protein
MSSPDRSTRALRGVGIVLYALAAAVLALGGYMSLSLASAPAALRSATIAFQTPIVALIVNGLASSLRTAGVALAIASLIVVVLLVACGLLLRRSAALAVRVDRLEAALAQRPR